MGMKEDSIYNLFLELRTPILKDGNGAWLDQLNAISVDKIDLLVSKLNKYFEIIYAFIDLPKNDAPDKQIITMINELEREKYAQKLISRIVTIYQEQKLECRVALKEKKTVTDIESILMACGVNIKIGETKEMHAALARNIIKLPLSSGISIDLSFDAVSREKFINPEDKFFKSLWSKKKDRELFWGQKQNFIKVFETPLPGFNTNKPSVSEYQQWFLSLNQREAAIQKEINQVIAEKNKIWFFHFRRKRSHKDWERMVCAKQKELALKHLEMFEHLNELSANLDESNKAEMLEKVIDCQLASLILLRSVFMADEALNKRYNNICSITKGSYYPSDAPKEQDVRAMWKLSQKKATNTDIWLLASRLELNNLSLQKFVIEERYGAYYLSAREVLFSKVENFFNCPSGNVSGEDNNILVLLRLFVENDKKNGNEEKLLAELNKLKDCAGRNNRGQVFFKYFGELMNQLLNKRCSHYNNITKKTGGVLLTEDAIVMSSPVESVQTISPSIPVAIINPELHNNSNRRMSYAKQ